MCNLFQCFILLGKNHDSVQLTNNSLNAIINIKLNHTDLRKIPNTLQHVHHTT